MLAGDPAREVERLCSWLVELNAAMLPDLPVLAHVAANAVAEPAADGAGTAALEAAYDRELDEDEALEAANERALDGRNVSVGLRWRGRRPSFSSSFSLARVSTILFLRTGGCGRFPDLKRFLRLTSSFMTAGGDGAGRLHSGKL